jgi:hypothetical protein
MQFLSHNNHFVIDESHSSEHSTTSEDEGNSLDQKIQTLITKVQKQDAKEI